MRRRRSACSSATGSAWRCTSGRSSAGSPRWTPRWRSPRAWFSRWRPTAPPATASRPPGWRRKWWWWTAGSRSSPSSPPRNCSSPTPIEAAMDEQAALGLYRTMTRIRQFEKRAHDLFLQNLVKGTTHLGMGQEAIAAGVAAAMRPDDYTFVTYRGHNHVLARGTEMTPVMAELLGRRNGLMRGKGGSMHLLDVSRGVLGSYAIIGAQLVIANGTAWSAQYRGSGQVTACFFGDGATNIGAFHEALNLAVVWALPVVFICENNQYMEYTAIETVTAVKRPAADRAPAYGLPSAVVDGNDVEAVHARSEERRVG